MTGHSSAQWAEVGRRIAMRIDDLSLTKAEVIRRSGVSAKTLDGYITGNAIRRRDKERDLALALGWTSDSVRRILVGGEPEERLEQTPRTARRGDEPTPAPPAPDPPAERIVGPEISEERFAALEREVADLKARQAAAELMIEWTPEQRAKLNELAARGFASLERDKRELAAQEDEQSGSRR